MRADLIYISITVEDEQYNRFFFTEYSKNVLKFILMKVGYIRIEIGPESFQLSYRVAVGKCLVFPQLR